MISDRILKKLSHIVGPDYLTTRESDLCEFSTDATKLSFKPDAIAFPANSREIAQILLLANEEYFPVVPRGKGSGKSGGALPVEGGLVLAMDRFDRILEIDPDNLIAKVEPAVITASFQKEVEKYDLYYPPDPASTEISTIGGNVAECAGGLKAVKYGVTRDYVLGLAVVLPTGEIIKTGVETPKGVVGYDLTRLIVGSEGTLAVITQITLRLIPRPATSTTLLAFFPDAAAAVRAVSRIIRSGVVPTAMEFLDRLCMDCVREDMPTEIPSDCNALLLLEIDGEESSVTSMADKVKDICAGSEAIHVRAASNKEEAESLWEARRNVSPSVYKLRPHKVSEDIVVPRTRMAELVSFLKRLANKYGLPMPAYGHAGDGNVHVNIMFDKGIPQEARSVDEAIKELFRKVIDMNGTISGEHGIGITKAPYIEMEISRPALQLMVRLKKAFDPKGILNPGKIFPYKS